MGEAGDVGNEGEGQRVRLQEFRDGDGHRLVVGGLRRLIIQRPASRLASV